MLASVYSYRVMVKSVSSCCVRGRWVLSNPVKYTVAIIFDEVLQDVCRLQANSHLVLRDCRFPLN